MESKSPRELAQEGSIVALACKCQRLIGSYEGSSMSCNCAALNDCLLTRRQREQLVHHPAVLEALETHRKAYDA